MGQASSALAPIPLKKLPRGGGLRHGLNKSPEHDAWRSMRHRCHNPKSQRFEHYGARGIFVCERWRDSFENFYEDVGPRPGPGYSLERQDNGKGYEPGNVVWATRVEQQRNKRSNRLVTFKGRTMPLTEASELAGIKPITVWTRLDRGWSEERALSEPLVSRGANLKGRGPRVQFRGQEMSLAEACDLAGLSYTVVSGRLKSGWPVERALSVPKMAPHRPKRA